MLIVTKFNEYINYDNIVKFYTEYEGVSNNYSITIFAKLIRERSTELLVISNYDKDKFDLYNIEYLIKYLLEDMAYANANREAVYNICDRIPSKENFKKFMDYFLKEDKSFTQAFAEFRENYI